MSWFGGRKRRTARVVVDEQRRCAEADERTARTDGEAAAARARWRARDAQRRANEAAQLELDRHRAATYATAVAADDVDDLVRPADHNDLTTSGRMLREEHGVRSGGRVGVLAWLRVPRDVRVPRSQAERSCSPGRRRS